MSGEGPLKVGHGVVGVLASPDLVGTMGRTPEPVRVQGAGVVFSSLAAADRRAAEIASSTSKDAIVVLDQASGNYWVYAIDELLPAFRAPNLDYLRNNLKLDLPPGISLHAVVATNAAAGKKLAPEHITPQTQPAQELLQVLQKAGLKDLEMRQLRGGLTHRMLASLQERFETLAATNPHAAHLLYYLDAALNTAKSRGDEVKISLDELATLAANRPVASASASRPGAPERTLQLGRSILSHGKNLSQLAFDALLAGGFTHLEKFAGDKIPPRNLAVVALYTNAATWTVVRDLHTGRLQPKDFGVQNWAAVTAERMLEVAQRRLAEGGIDNTSVAAMINDKLYVDSPLLMPGDPPKPLTLDTAKNLGFPTLAVGVSPSLYAAQVVQRPFARAILTATTLAAAGSEAHFAAAHLLVADALWNGEGVVPNATQALVAIAGATETPLLEMKTLPLTTSAADIDAKVAAGALAGYRRDSNSLITYRMRSSAEVCAEARTRQEPLERLLNELGDTGARALEAFDRMSGPNDNPGALLAARLSGEEDLRFWRDVREALVEDAIVLPVGLAAHAYTSARLLTRTTLFWQRTASAVAGASAFSAAKQASHGTFSLGEFATNAGFAVAFSHAYGTLGPVVAKYWERVPLTGTAKVLAGEALKALGIVPPTAAVLTGWSALEREIKGQPTRPGQVLRDLERSAAQALLLYVETRALLALIPNLRTTPALTGARLRQVEAEVNVLAQEHARVWSELQNNANQLADAIEQLGNMRTGTPEIANQMQQIDFLSRKLRGLESSLEALRHGIDGVLSMPQLKSHQRALLAERRAVENGLGDTLRPQQQIRATPAPSAESPAATQQEIDVVCARFRLSHSPTGLSGAIRDIARALAAYDVPPGVKQVLRDALAARPRWQLEGAVPALMDRPMLARQVYSALLRREGFTAAEAESAGLLFENYGIEVGFVDGEVKVYSETPRTLALEELGLAPRIARALAEAAYWGGWFRNGREALVLEYQGSAPRAGPLAMAGARQVLVKGEDLDFVGVAAERYGVVFDFTQPTPRVVSGTRMADVIKLGAAPNLPRFLMRAVMNELQTLDRAALGRVAQTHASNAVVQRAYLETFSTPEIAHAIAGQRPLVAAFEHFTGGKAKTASNADLVSWFRQSTQLSAASLRAMAAAPRGARAESSAVGEALFAAEQAARAAEAARFIDGEMRPHGLSKLPRWLGPGEMPLRHAWEGVMKFMNQPHRVFFRLQQIESEVQTLVRGGKTVEAARDAVFDAYEAWGGFGKAVHLQHIIPSQAEFHAFLRRGSLSVDLGFKGGDHGMLTHRTIMAAITAEMRANPKAFAPEGGKPPLPVELYRLAGDESFLARLHPADKTVRLNERFEMWDELFDREAWEKNAGTPEYVVPRWRALLPGLAWE